MRKPCEVLQVGRVYVAAQHARVRRCARADCAGESFDEAIRLRLKVMDVSAFDLCRQNHILCQGRGSAANSAVCYCLGITAIDPVQMDLLFERFISRAWATSSCVRPRLFLSNLTFELKNISKI